MIGRQHLWQRWQVRHSSADGTSATVPEKANLCVICSAIVPDRLGRGSVVRGHHAQHREQRVYGVPEVEPSVHEENATFGGMRIESDSDGALSSYVVF